MILREFSSSPEPTEAEVEPFSLEKEEEEEEEEEDDDDDELPTNSMKKKKKKMMMMKKSKNKRRFSDQQVRSLESIFQSETKLDPQKKLQVARDLGLQPRQVAIWFQNKRARWKSKEIENNYRVLKANYDSLKTQFESTKRDKESLLLQLQELQNQLEKLHRGKGTEACVLGKIEESAAERSMVAEELQRQGATYYEGATYSHDDRKAGNIAYLGQEEEETELLNIENHMHSSAAPQAKWCGLDSGNLLDQASTSSHWWDSWT